MLDILQDAIKDDAVVISTLVDSHLAATARNFSRVNHLSYLDLMNPFLKSSRKKQATQPIEVPGVLAPFGHGIFQ